MKAMLLTIIFLVLNGCVTSSIKDADCHERKVDTVTKSVDNVDFLASFSYDTSTILISLLNNSKNDIKILWSESYFVDSQNRALKMFSGKIIDRDKQQQDQIVPAGLRADSAQGIVENVYWSGSSWSNNPMCGRSVTPYGKIDMSGCKDMLVKIVYLFGKNKKEITFPVVTKVTLKKVCEGYDLTTGQKLQK